MSEHIPPIIRHKKSNPATYFLLQTLGRSQPRINIIPSKGISNRAKDQC